MKLFLIAFIWNKLFHFIAFLYCLPWFFDFFNFAWVSLFGSSNTSLFKLLTLTLFKLFSLNLQFLFLFLLFLSSYFIFWLVRYHAKLVSASVPESRFPPESSVKFFHKRLHSTEPYIFIYNTYDMNNIHK